MPVARCSPSRSISLFEYLDGASKLAGRVERETQRALGELGARACAVARPGRRSVALRYLEPRVAPSRHWPAWTAQAALAIALNKQGRPYWDTAFVPAGE